MPEHYGPVNFTDVEIKIICLYCEDRPTKEIAEKLSLRTRTIDKYIKEIVRKMDKRNEVGLILYALEYGIYKIE